MAALSERRRDTTGIGNIALKMEEPPYQQSQGEPLLKRCLFQRQNVLFRFVPRVLRQVVAGGLAAGKLIAAFVLGMDSQLLCSPDCKGICFRCGKNLNEGPCGCRKEPDSRFAVLQQLLDK